MLRNIVLHDNLGQSALDTPSSTVSVKTPNKAEIWYILKNRNKSSMNENVYNVEHNKNQLAGAEADHRGLCRPRWGVLILLTIGKTRDGFKEGSQII